MSQSGIQSLLQTEKDAQQVVADARAYRAEKLRAAKADAQKEIAAYKQKKAEELAAFESQFDGANTQLEADADAEAQQETAAIQKTAQEKQKAVVSILVNAVANSNPAMHINA